MNCIHSHQYKKIAKHILDGIDTAKALRILDVGCGGGKAIRLFRALAADADVHGVDISPDMVALAGRVNKEGVRNGRVAIVQGDVAALPYPDHSFDIVTAFDTINFWPTLDKALEEVRRVLQINGLFVIVNGYPDEGSKWHAFVKLKNCEAYRDFLTAYGFRSIRIAVHKHTITIEAGR